MAKKYKVKSDYTLLRNRSQVIDRGTVYENNFLTINPSNDLYSDEGVTLYSDSNFRFSYNTTPSLYKKHSKGAWLNPDNSSNGFWTREDVEDAPISDETIIRIKPDYNSLRDFAYFGSSVEMVKAAVNDVIMNFPAEIYFSNEDFQVPSGTGYTTLGGTVYNDFGINLELDYVNESTVSNKMRYMCISSENYDLYEKGKRISEGVTFTVSPNKNFNCETDKNGGTFATVRLSSGGKTLDITVYQKDGVKSYYSNKGNAGYSIRPCDVVINEFFATIDDFEYVLLGKEGSVPYSAVFETPYETDTGNKYTMESYIWPSINDWNPVVSGPEFDIYVSKLIKLAEFSDIYDSDNIWRMMTHEAIKNLDWTYKKYDGDDVDEFSDIDSARIARYVRIIGRQFDGLKRYVDNIKNHNKVSYDEKNNTPDYELSDLLVDNGWDVCTLNPTAQSTQYSDQLYKGRKEGYSEVDMNMAFMRNLKINTRYLTALRGTRHGLDAMMGLLGLKQEDYEITEHVSIFSGKGGYCSTLNSMAEYLNTEAAYYDSSKVNYPPYNSVAAINSYKNYFYDDYNEEMDEEIDYLKGIPVKKAVVNDESGKILYEYVVPWYDMNKKYDGDWYFQSKGGWGKRTKKVLNPFGDKEVELTNVYSESDTYMKYVNDVTELLSFYTDEIKDGDICYVTDLGDISRYNGTITDSEYSHYFILRSVDYSTVFGTVNGNTGWEYISMSDLAAGTSPEAQKVIYLETLEEKYDGNNPHVGYGDYDNGEEYLDYMSDIFHYANNNNGFEMFTTGDRERIKGFAFSRKDEVDNDKVWYYSNKANWANTKLGKLNGKTWTKQADESFDKSQYSPAVVEEGHTPRNEPSANSVVNVKNMEIKFNISKLPAEIQEGWKSYIEGTAMNYITQMIPSTTIWSYSFA